jgi:hypothetical protein
VVRPRRSARHAWWHRRTAERSGQRRACRSSGQDSVSGAGGKDYDGLTYGVRPIHRHGNGQVPQRDPVGSHQTRVVAPREGPKSLFIATINPSAVRIDLPRLSQHLSSACYSFWQSAYPKAGEFHNPVSVKNGPSTYQGRLRLQVRRYAIAAPPSFVSNLSSMLAPSSRRARSIELFGSMGTEGSLVDKSTRLV